PCPPRRCSELLRRGHPHVVQQQAEGGEHLRRRLEGVGEEQEGAHRVPPPPSGAVRSCTVRSPITSGSSSAVPAVGAPPAPLRQRGSLRLASCVRRPVRRRFPASYYTLPQEHKDPCALPPE